MDDAVGRLRGHLSYEEIHPSDSRSFAKLYAIYADLFPLKDEREPPDAFHEIAMLNERTDVQLRYGPWREFVSAIRLWDGGPLVGGHVFGVTTSPAHRQFGCLASVQAIYTFMETESRGRGTIRDMRRYLEASALSVFGFKPEQGSKPPLVLFEVNNPLRMTAEEIEQDTARSGLDPHRRYAFWKRSGFAPLDLPYVQPRLREDSMPVHYLDLFCSAHVAEAIPSDLIINHLRAFISLSVLKGRSAEEDPDFQSMLQALSAVSLIRFAPDSDPRQIEIARRAREASTRTRTT